MKRWILWMLMGGWPLLAPAAPGLTLSVASPPRPGILTGCELFFFAHTEGQPWRPVTRPLRLAWDGGGVDLNVGAAPEPSTNPLREHCFRLELDGQLLTGGAVLSPHSARRLNFPVLVEDPGRDGRPPRLRLLPNWTVAGNMSPAPPDRATILLRERFP